MASDQCICSKCGQTIGEGAIKWNLSIKLWADEVGYLLGSHRTDKDIESEIKKLLQKIQDMDATNLEEQVYQEFQFELCRDCRDLFIKNPLSIPSDL